MARRDRFRPDLGLELVTVHIPGLLQVVHWGNGIDRSTIRRSSHGLVHNRAPEILDLMATPCTKINQLVNLWWGVTYPLIMMLYAAFSRHQQSLPNISKGHLKPGFVLDQPVLNPSRRRVLNTTQKEVDGKTGSTTKHAP